MEIATGYGLHKRATFNEIVNYIEDDPTIIKFPNRMAIWAGDNPFLTQLDDNWLEDSVGPRHAQLQHQLWLATHKVENPQAIYDPETGTTAALGDVSASDMSVAAVEDLTRRSLEATDYVRLTDAGTVAAIPGIELPDAEGEAIDQETGGRWWQIARGSIFGRAKEPDLTVLGPKPLAPSGPFMPPARPQGASASGLVRGAASAAASAASAAARGVGTAAGAVGTAAGAVALTAGTAIGVVGQVAATAQPLVAGLGSVVGTGLQGLDTLADAIMTPVLDDFKDRVATEAGKMFHELMGLGPAGERPAIEGTFLPVQVLNGEVPGFERLSSGRSSGRTGGPTPLSLPTSYGPSYGTERPGRASSSASSSGYPGRPGRSGRPVRRRIDSPG